MHAMVLHDCAHVETSPLQWRELPDPLPGPGEVRIKVICCAVCRTDLHVIEGELPRRHGPAGLIPGHQVVGTVDRLGEGCRRLRLGQRIGIAWLRGTCGVCEFCRSGRENLCPNARFTGYDANGGYATHALVAEDFAYELPDAFGDAEATPLLCAGIIGYRSLQRARPRPGCKLGLYGFGSSAHIVIQIARHRGYEIYVAARDQKHRDLARELGAVWAGDHPSKLPGPVDSAILFAPVGDLVPPSLEKLKPGGTLSIAGIYLTDIPPLNYQRHVFYERELCSVTCNTREDGRNLLAEAAAIPVHPHTVTYPLREANGALQDLKADRIAGTGVLIV